MKKMRKILAFLLVLCMMLSFVPAMTFAAKTVQTNVGAPLTSQNDPEEEGEEQTQALIEDYDLFMTRLKELENAADNYAAENSKDAYALVLNYIRTGVEKYRDSLWAGVAGAEEEAFIAYVAAQDEANGTHVSDLRSLGNVTIPNGDSIEVVHLFAVLDIANYQSRNDASVAQPYKDFGGWLGDLVDLLYQVQKGNVDCTTDFEAGVADIRENYLGADLGRNCFDFEDIHADLDAVYLMAKHDETGEKVSKLLEDYYTPELNDHDRAAFYMANRYPELTTIARTRQQIHKDYTDNVMAFALESKRDIDRTEHPEWIKGVCYAWADYICATAGITEFGEYAADPTPTPEPTPAPTPTPAPLDNEYYRVFSSHTTTVAHGVTQTIRMANSADDKQMVYYIATADVNRPDVTMAAGYKDYDGTVWGMQSVTDQAAAAMSAHAGEDFNVVVATNADFFNMGTGKPTGALVMNGVEYNGAGNEPFFAIMKDGSAKIGAASEYASCKDQIQEAVGCNAYLVKEGKLAQGKPSNYMSTRASRTCVGITEDGQVVLMVLDGRQEPWSCGGSMGEIAQIMLDAGCVTAVNLDGGGSTTFASKAEGSDELTVLNRPSDGFERRVSSSLMIVSTAKISNELDHANLNVESNYLAVGATVAIDAVGVSESGNSAPLPENAEWVVSDETVGTMNGNVFESEDVGDVTISLMDGEKELGSVELHVVVPDEIAFEPQEFDAIYGETMKLPLAAYYDNNVVLLPEDPDWADSMVIFRLDKKAAGSVYGFDFTAAGDDCGIRTTTIKATLWDDSSVTCEGTIRLFRADEASFDFNNCTAGDRKLAWNRTVSNSTTSDDVTYYQDNPDEPMVVNYTFALDMNDLDIPENVAQALPAVAAFLGEGQVNGDTTAWELLLMLAERISPSTTVTVTVNVDPRLEMDLSEMKVNCQYFELTDSRYDEANSQIILTCNWIKVYGPIDPGTANPLCIVSGLKGTVKDNANWDSNHEIQVENSGSITYKARLRSSQAYNLANSPIGRSYGLQPYDNSANLVNDKGAEFSSTHTSFTDQFIFVNTLNIIKILCIKTY